MSDIFISHVEEDEAIARDIAAGLEAAGYSCWYYERDGLPGVRYLVQIDKAIEQAQAVVVVISRDSLSSSQVDSEVERAHESAKHFIPILLGIKHVEFQNRKPVWRMAMGTATSLPIPIDGISAIIPRIVAGAHGLGIVGHANQGIKSADTVATEPAESPERKKFQVLAQDKESMDSNSSIAASYSTARTSASSAGKAPRHDNEPSSSKSLFDHLLGWSPGRRKTLAVVAASFILLISGLLIVKHYRAPREPVKNPVTVDYAKIKLLRTLKSNDKLISLALSPDGKTLACGHSGGAVTILDTGTGQLMRTLIGHYDEVYGVAFSPDGQKLATAGGLDHTTRLWDARTGQQKFVVSFGLHFARAVAFSPDGKVLASGGGSGFILSDAETGEMKFQEAEAPAIVSLSFSPDGKIIASGDWKHTVRLWNTQTGALLQTFNRNESEVDVVAFSPNGDTLASGLRGYFNYQNNYKLEGIEINVWDVRTAELRKVLTGPSKGIRSLVFLPDGKTLVSTSRDGTISLWNSETGQRLRTLEENVGDSGSLSLAYDGSLLAVGRIDGTIMLWNMR